MQIGEKEERGGIAARGRPFVVLLVDDQPFVGAAVRRLLAASADIELHCCHEPSEALPLARELAPAVILQDLKMPGVDGLSLVRAYCEEPATAATRVIVLSGNDDAGTRASAGAAGAVDFLVKLPPQVDLIACLRRHASHVGDALAPGSSHAASATVDMTLDPAVVDRFRQAGSPAFLRKLVDQFTSEAELRVGRLKAAAAADDHAAMQAAAHTLRGSASIVGAQRLATLAAEAELSAAASNPVAPALVGAMEAELTLVRAALAELAT